MKLNGKKNAMFLACLLGAIFGSVNLTFAQERNPEDNKPSVTNEMYMISASAGAVSYVSGTVFIARKNFIGNDPIKKDYNLKDGEVIRTEANGKVEVLLNPGSYLRVGNNSEFYFNNTSLDELSVKLEKGAAIFEVSTNKSMRKDGFAIEIVTPQTKIFLNQSGIYRINILPNNTTEVLIWRGEAKIGSKTAKAVDAGRRVLVTGMNQTIAKFSKAEHDDFDTWSNFRAEAVARLNSRLRSNELARSLYEFAGVGSLGNGMGVWVYDRILGRWFFLPSYRGWSSPYGYYCPNYYPWYQYYPPVGVTPSNPQAKGVVARSPAPPIRILPNETQGDPNEGVKFPPIRKNDPPSFDNDASKGYLPSDSSSGPGSRGSSAPPPVPAPAPAPHNDTVKGKDN